MSKQTVAVIDYGSGNLRSAAKAFQHVAESEGLEADVIITSRAEDVARADRIVLPGQGAFGDCIGGLKNVDGMIAALEEAVLQKARPFFGICVGMQLMASRGLEHGVHQGLGWIEGDVVRMTPSDPALKIPHMGWNTLDITTQGRAHPVLRGITQKGVDGASGHAPHFYFVHSFMVQLRDQRQALAECGYGGSFTAIIGRDNMIGTQFHPEKSQEDGLMLIRDFLLWKP